MRTAKRVTRKETRATQWILLGWLWRANTPASSNAITKAPATSPFSLWKAYPTPVLHRSVSSPPKEKEKKGTRVNKRGLRIYLDVKRKSDWQGKGDESDVDQDFRDDTSWVIRFIDSKGSKGAKDEKEDEVGMKQAEGKMNQDEFSLRVDTRIL